MSADLVRLPVRFVRPKPDAISILRDFGRWSIRFYAAGKFHHNQFFDSEAQARAEADRLVRDDGLTWHVPMDGGCRD